MIVNNKKVQNDPSQEKIKFILKLFNSNKLIETKNGCKKPIRITNEFPLKRAVKLFIDGILKKKKMNQYLIIK